MSWWQYEHLPVQAQRNDSIALLDGVVGSALRTALVDGLHNAGTYPGVLIIRSRRSGPFQSMYRTLVAGINNSNRRGGGSGPRHREAGV
jgi:hypothetical protein